IRGKGSLGLVLLWRFHNQLWRFFSYLLCLELGFDFLGIQIERRTYKIGGCDLSSTTPPCT
ncbi:hypothetical protein S83_047280, partial [Arachis hypogaea]